MPFLKKWKCDGANKLSVTHNPIECHPLPGGLRAVHLSDFHYDPAHRSLSPELLDTTIERVNALNADLIFLTGDYVNKDPSPIDELASKWLSRLRANIGIYASLGNHDSFTTEGKDRITRALTGAGITVLRNESVSILDNALTIVGLEDLWGSGWEGHGKAMEEAVKRGSGYTIVLSHNPDTAPLLRQYPFDLHLAGHTHGGQLCYPNGTPVLSIVRNLATIVPFKLVQKVARKVTKGRGFLFVSDDWRRSYGRFEMEGVGSARTLIVNRGLGAHGGVRLNCPPEIGVFDFE